MKLASRLPIILASLLVIFGVLSACGQQTAAPQNNTATTNTNQKMPNTTTTNDTAADKIELGKNGPVTINFWHIQASIYGEAIKEIVAEFNKKYEGKIVVNEVFQGDYGELNKKIRAALLGGGLPEVAMAYESDTLQYMKADQIVPLDQYINDPEYGLTEAELKDIAPGVLARQRIPEYEGKTMSWPHGNSAMGVYYNIDLLKQAGYDRPAKTWKEFEQQAITIKEKTGIPALVISNNFSGGTFRTWLRTYGISPIAQDQNSVNYDNEATIELLKIMKNLIDRGAIVFGENTEQEFTNGRAAMEIGTTARTSSKIDLIGDKFNWTMDMIPQGDPNKEPITELYGGNQVMFKSNPEKQLASWLFLKYFAGPEAQAIYAAKTGYFPATVSSLDTALLKENYSKYPQKKDAFERVFKYARIDVSTAARNAIDSAVGKVVQAVLTGQMTPEKAAKEAQAQATKALEENK